VKHQEQQGTLGMLLADCRDTITEATGVMHSQTSEVLHRLDMLPQCLQPPPRCGLPAWQAWLCGGLVGALLLGGAWLLWPRPRGVYDQLLGAVDAVLVQHYATLPTPVQQQLSAAYARQGVQGPGQRQPKGGAR